MGLNQSVLDACTAQGLLAAVAKVPDNPGGRPYAVIWPDGPVRSAASLADGHGEETTVYVCHIIGLTPDAVDVAERKLAAAFAGLYRQVLNGRLVKFPEQDWAQPLSSDGDTIPPLYDMAVEWRLRTTPA